MSRERVVLLEREKKKFRTQTQIKSNAGSGKFSSGSDKGIKPGEWRGHS